MRTITLRGGLAVWALAALAFAPPVVAAENGGSIPQLRLPQIPGAASAGRKFMLFFDFDSAAVSSEARDLAKYAVELSARGGVSVVTITGYTDTVGSRFYNLKLSQRRAVAVRNLLVRNGAPRGQLQVYWRGEFDPLVPTADGVDEFRNRRVEIVIE